MAIELTDEIKNSEAYKRYEKVILRKRKDAITGCIDRLTTQIIKDYFGHHVKRKKSRAFKETSEFKILLEKALEKDHKYIAYTTHRESLLDEELSYFIANKEIIDEMWDAGETSFSKGEIEKYKNNLEYYRNYRVAKKIYTEVFDHFGAKSFVDLERDVWEQAADIYIIELEKLLSQGELCVFEYNYDYYSAYQVGTLALVQENFEEFLDQFFDTFGLELFRECVGNPENIIVNLVKEKLQNFVKGLSYEKKYIDFYFTEFEEEMFENCGWLEDFSVSEKVSDHFTREKVIELLNKNHNYTEMLQEINKAVEQERLLKEAVLDHIPDRYIDLYPLARKLHRKFILHLGPTNSGKTYSAIERLVQGENGIYLGPLRLLAFEQFEKINDLGVKCSLLTGEEEIWIDGANFQASTVEMLDLRNYYDIAVIDEAQLLTDEFRGGNWTKAILGINAKEIHVCAALNAEQILIRLITECGDEYEIIRHERLAELKRDVSVFEFPNSVQAGDALIVFSRKSVHGVAAELQQAGYKCSVIYGALPYDVRHEEARRFMEKETDVLVATDAVGLGLNLPIRRVVLLEQTKFDGYDVRQLRPEEVQQIFGRAGRAGIYDVGLYNLYGSGNIKKKMLSYVEKTLPEIVSARLSFPETLLGIDSDISNILEKWNDLSVQDGFIKSSVDREIKLAKMLEEMTEDKQLIYSLITIPFDEENIDLLQHWLEFIRGYIKKGVVKVYVYNSVEGFELVTDDDLKDAESLYSMLDLEYQLCRRFGTEDQIKYILGAKSDLSKKIIGFLSKAKLRGRKCSICGKHLSWNYPYGRCNACHQKIVRNYDWW